MTDSPLRIAVVDDQQLLVAAFRSLLDAQPDMTVVATAHNGDEALKALRQAHARGEAADVVLMDIRMPVLDGIAATRQLLADPGLGSDARERPPRVLMLTTFQEEDLVMGALRAGASGFALKDSGSADLLTAVRAVAAGHAWLDPVITPYVLQALEGRPDAVGVAVPEPERPASEAGTNQVTVTSSAPVGTPPRDGGAAAAATGLLPGERLTQREREVLDLVCRGLSNAEIAARLYVAESTVKTHVKAVLGRTGCRNRVELVIHAFTTGLVQPGR
ncbi:response regulator transcription factor [Actinomyces sp. MRS3W]|uniref:response regulator transcription factor n=1 Tax=Actinomyces sp. MRS3W TaxID=2800796 RepID=UPI0028FD9589|nr:response regulator transcription factor [Actinomyces sp. MRS3W]MDU0349008.1 response regulator transcription factor [Actinomyces sp. MRS3W]